MTQKARKISPFAEGSRVRVAIKGHDSPETGGRRSLSVENMTLTRLCGANRQSVDRSDEMMM